ncbi:exopolysaccharide biosynthesis polyprenyl glycosylphosphotransferase [Rhodopirellula sallentina]|nr:exopolysaccharide biosynthesis polyprenyl glycosylphosphotransferase [Rhodopirellula sallentina]
MRDVTSAVPLLVVDVLVAVAASLVGAWLSYWLGAPLHPVFPYAIVFLTVFLQSVHGLYPGVGIQYPAEFRGVLRTSVFVSLGIAFAMVARANPSFFHVFSWLAVSSLLFLGLASLRPIARQRLKRYDWWTQPVAVIGSGERAMRLVQRIDGLGHEGFRAAGLISDMGQTWSANHSVAVFSSRMPLRWLGPQAELESILKSESICRVAVADRETVGWRDFHCFHGIPHVMLPGDLGQQPIERMRMRENSGEVEICCDTSLVNPMALTIKRVMDLFLVGLAAPIWLFVMGVIAVAMKCIDPGPIFYRQSRVGRNGELFDAMKFRSMVVNADQKLEDYLSNHPEMRAEWQATHKLQNDPRITKIGAFLRKSSLDELPQLFNVLRGEMSLVGPRPIVDSGNYDREYIQEHPDVYELYRMVRPGITGLWQVSGRNQTSYKERVFYDRFYLHNWSLSQDIFILWRTIKTALFREGAC